MVLKEIRNQKPIIHCMTNYVVANFQANGLLAVGASPIMAEHFEEMADVSKITDALLLNIGTIRDSLCHSMIFAGQLANSLNKPVVLDPVGIGVSSFRQEFIHALLQKVQFTAIRCNASELATLAQIDCISHGIDAGVIDFSVTKTAMDVALKYSTIVCVSGETDYITNGFLLSEIHGGTKKLTEITGTGCLLGALCTAASASSKDVFHSLVHLHEEYKNIATIAANNCEGIGDFQADLLNQLKYKANEVLL